jgi:glutathione S-transferase
VQFVDMQTAKPLPGLRLVVVRRLPSPWSESAKGLFLAKGLDFTPVTFRSGDAEMERWTGTFNAPVAILDDEIPRSSWADILLLAERLGDRAEPRRLALIPKDPEQRAFLFGLGHEILGQDGLAWNGRLLLIEAGLLSDGARGFPLPVARRLAPSYGYAPGCGEHARARIRDVCALLATQLEHGRAAGGPWYFGAEPSAVDVWSAAALHVLAPLPEDVCPMLPVIRAAFTWLAEEMAGAVPPALIEHRDRVYGTLLRLPMEL